jgi:hypothetical protein
MLQPHAIQGKAAERRKNLPTNRKDWKTRANSVKLGLGSDTT